MELQDACVTAHQEISGFHAEIPEVLRRLDRLSGEVEGREEVVPEIRGLHSAVEDLDRKVSELERQLPPSSLTASDEIPWNEWI
jgi:hypothetical protein